MTPLQIFATLKYVTIGDPLAYKNPKNKKNCVVSTTIIIKFTKNTIVCTKLCTLKM